LGRNETENPSRHDPSLPDPKHLDHLKKIPYHIEAMRRIAAKCPDTLRLGMSGMGVLELQQRLKYFGFQRENPNGKFGLATEDAVKELQRVVGLPVDGLADLRTWERLVALAMDRFGFDE